MLILGCDRNNDTVARLFDERNLAVKRAIHHLIEAAHKDGKTVSICGQAPSEFPEFTNFLIQSGIDMFHLTPIWLKNLSETWPTLNNGLCWIKQPVGEFKILPITIGRKTG